MRSAADMDEVGCPEPAAAEERTESTRSCCPNSRHCSCLSIAPPRVRLVPAADDSGSLPASSREASACAAVLEQEYSAPVAPRLSVGFAVLAALLVGAVPATASTRAPAAARPLTCVKQHCRGYIPVPLDRTGFTPGHVELYVSEWLPDGPSKGVVLELAGGPGQSSSYAFDEPVDLWEGWTQVAYDNRGTGQSSRIACGPFVGSDARRDISRCNDLLGPERAFYSTRDNAADMEAVRALLGVDKVALWGTSYGTKQALAYAHAYPSHVDRLLLDSTLLPAGPDAYDLQYGRSVPAGLRALCGTTLCTRATPDIGVDVAVVANALAATPIDGTVAFTPGKPAQVHLDGY